MVQICMGWDLIFNLNIKHVKYIIILALFPIAGFVYAQNPKIIINTEASKDSLNQTYNRINSDTTSIRLRMRFINSFPAYKDQRSPYTSLNYNLLKSPKYDPYKKKFTDLQIINIIGSHLSR